MLAKQRIKSKERRDRERAARQAAAGAVPNGAIAPMSIYGDAAMMDVEGIAAADAAVVDVEGIAAADALGAMLPDEDDDLDNVDPTRRSDMQYLANRAAQGLSNELSDVDMGIELDDDLVDSFHDLVDSFR